jgi:hypothetical protein
MATAIAKALRAMMIWKISEEVNEWSPVGCPMNN